MDRKHIKSRHRQNAYLGTAAIWIADGALLRHHEGETMWWREHDFQGTRRHTSNSCHRAHAVLRCHHNADSRIKLRHPSWRRKCSNGFGVLVTPKLQEGKVSQLLVGIGLGDGDGDGIPSGCRRIFDLPPPSLRAQNIFTPASSVTFRGADQLRGMVWGEAPGEGAFLPCLVKPFGHLL